MMLGVMLSLIGVLLLPFQIKTERDCVVECLFPQIPEYEPVLPPEPLPPEPPPPEDPWQPPPDWTPPTECDPRDPSPPVPDVTEIDWPDGEITHAAGDGDVVVGMDTKFYWDGPTEVTWTQRGRAGVREDCSVIPGPEEEFTARAETVLFDFETGEGQLQYVTDDRTATHRYAEAGVWTVCVYVGFEVPGSDTTGLVRLAELDHEVKEIRSTLVQ